jgi:hypothetical protein
VLKTRDGETFQPEAAQGSEFIAISAESADTAWVVKRNGTVWIVQPAPQPPPPKPPPPQPPPPPPHPPPVPLPVQKPSISVSSSGSGQGSVFVVSGHGFSPNTNVRIRVVDNALSELDFYRSSDGQGNLSATLGIPCISGLGLHFSATDGRPDQTDLTGFLWSNTVNTSCP